MELHATGNIEKARKLSEGDVLFLMGKVAGVGNGAGAGGNVRDIVMKTRCTCIFYETEPYDRPPPRANFLMGDRRKFFPFHEVWTCKLYFWKEFLLICICPVPLLFLPTWGRLGTSSLLLLPSFTD